MAWQAEASLTAYFDFYRRERFHQSLDYRTPTEIYFADRGCDSE